MVVFFWWCFCGGEVVFLWCPVVWWCFCGGVCVVVFLFWCGGIFVVVFLRLCFCGGGGGGVFAVFLCFCDGVALPRSYALSVDNTGVKGCLV